jgi:hypothetical protein
VIPGWRAKRAYAGLFDFARVKNPPATAGGTDLSAAAEPHWQLVPCSSFALTVLEFHFLMLGERVCSLDRGCGREACRSVRRGVSGGYVRPTGIDSLEVFAVAFAVAALRVKAFDLSIDFFVRSDLDK